MTPVETGYAGILGGIRGSQTNSHCGGMPGKIDIQPGPLGPGHMAQGKGRATHKLLREYNDVFSLKDNELRCTSQDKHSMKVMVDEPFKEQFRHIPPPLLGEVRTHVNDMLQAGAIQPSNSPWCSAVVLIQKKDGGLHFCIDFQKLNAKTKKDSYPLPWIQETLESLEGSHIFSSFDLKSGFWQVEMDEESKQYTTFMVGSFGFL